MSIKVINYLWGNFKRKMKSERGFWAAVGALVSAYLSYKAASAKKKNDYSYEQLPGYGESDMARKEAWNKVQQWGGQEGYGAIPMNWDEIWNQAKDKVSRYYWGGVNDPGLAGKIRASAARRGVSQSPALENQLTSLGFQEAADLNDLATTEATNKAQYSEAGRQNWLQSMMTLAGFKPSYVTSSLTSNDYGSSYGAANAIGDISIGLGNLFSQYAQNETQRQGNADLLEMLRDSYGGRGGMPGYAQFSLTGDMMSGDSTLSSQYPNLFRNY